MKKFFTAISLQNRDLEAAIYQPGDNIDFLCKEKVSFPILITINNFVNKGEKIIVYPIIIKAKSSNNNFEIFKKELNNISIKNGFTYELHPIYKELGDTIDDMIKLFSKLIDVVDNEDELFACITYGTKPISVLTIMALNYAYKVKKDVKIEKIIYGCRDWDNTKELYSYDVTALFYIDSAINSLSKLKLEHPETALRAMLGLE